MREQYETLETHKGVTFNEIKQSITEMEVDMEVDEEDKNKIINFLLQETNIVRTVTEDIEMT